MNRWSSYRDVEALNRQRVSRAIRALTALRSAMLGLEHRFEPAFAKVRPTYVEGARNLVHYVALRRHDLRDIQRDLQALGLSSLGRSEARALPSLDAVLAVLRRLSGEPPPRPPADAVAGYDLEAGAKRLAMHTEALLGPAPSGRRVRILVTLPGEAADHPDLARDLVRAGMDCARINCAHDDPARWAAMIENLRRAQRDLRRSGRILMDLAGPKLRTGPLPPGPKVLKWRPRRDVCGRVIGPARLWLTRADRPTAPPEPVDAVLPVAPPARILDCARVDAAITLRDLRGKTRTLTVRGTSAAGLLAEASETAYVGPETPLILRPTGTTRRSAGRTDRTGDLPAHEEPILLRPGDTLVLTAEPGTAAPVPRDGEGRPVGPARISCSLPEVLRDVCVGERIWFDDGKIGGRITAVEGSEARIEIVHARPEGSKLRSDKGINLPDTRLRLSGLTPDDLRNLDFVCAHADAVALSFVREANDVLQLQAQLEARGARHLGVVLKIETRQAFTRLPQILLAAMRNEPIGVMIARGDLAVEAGWERMAEVQEEILWLCEAAHVPVIWATQVLESLNKTGLPSRAEITDAAMSERAECVMLNKGPFVVRAVEVLDDILRRMQEHQEKKAAMLRPLRVADLPGEDGNAGDWEEPP